MDINILYHPIFWIVFLLDFIFKAFALWKCGRNNQPGWYIVLFILNTGGILPLIYLLGFQRKKENPRPWY